MDGIEGREGKVAQFEAEWRERTESCDRCTRIGRENGKLRNVYENGAIEQNVATERKVATSVRERRQFGKSCDMCLRMERENGKLRHMYENGAREQKVAACVREWSGRTES